ncbi:hypothetical protein GCM10009677_01410 [Sphaerisporangium rubeum]
MVVMRGDEAERRRAAARAAYRLRGVLEGHGISGRVREGRGVALVEVCADLVAWTDGRCYFWWSGVVSETTRRRTYSYGPADDPVTTARRVAGRYAQLRERSTNDGGAEQVG